ncbi:hypothetical protein RSOL_241280, partial [Rhizoctonia solani AG-3 Rhs1AP]
MGRPKPGLVFRTLIEKGGKLIRTKSAKSKSAPKPTEVNVSEKDGPSGSRASKLQRTETPRTSLSEITPEHKGCCSPNSSTVPAEDEWGFEESGFTVPPAPDYAPTSGFTIRLLRHFGIFSTLAKGSAHKYYAMLERQTRPGFPGYLLMLRRSGITFPQHPKPAFEDSLAIKCPACPNPGLNFELVEVPAEEVYWISFDGNFKNARKAKVFSNDDICFTVGDMYFVDQELYKAWLKSRDSEEDASSKRAKDRPECDNHKAAQDKFVGLRGLDVTGIGALTCTRHTFFLPNGVVDFYKGERFVYSDYAFASVVLYLIRHGNLPIGMTYDIWCHWIPNLKKRLQDLPERIALPADLDLAGGIPKFHLQGHANVCWVRYSLNNMQFVGRIEGEGVERAWAYLNETAGSTCEKSPGARWDSINLILSDWNFDKMVRMVSSLVTKFQEAIRMFHRLLEVFLELDESLPVPLTKAWRDVPTKPTETAPGKWMSPFQAAEHAGEGFQEAIKREQENEDKLNSESSQQVGVTKWVSSGIELQYSMELVRWEVKKIGKDATAGQHNYLNDRRKQLNDRIVLHRGKRDGFMGDVGEPDHPDLRPAAAPDPEHTVLGLPSSYNRHTQTGSATSSLAQLEIQLRRAACNDALESLKNLLGAKILAYKYKKEIVSGVRATTRAMTALREHEERVSRMRWKYNNSQAALLRLSKEQSDVDTYRVIEDKDVKQLTHYIEDRTREVGQRELGIPWIWRSRAAETKEGWQAEALRTEWFRARQRYKQWEEELKLLKREMVMTIRQFSSYFNIWLFKSNCEGLTPGMSEYAARKSDFYFELQAEAIRQCLPLIKDPIVELKWASAWVSTFEADQV